jgi:HK97 family phage portal protein
MGVVDFVSNLFTKKETRTHQQNPALFNLLGASGGSGMQVDTETALTNTAVWAAIRILSESVAQLPIQLFENTEGGDKLNRKDHNLAKLLKIKPNQYMTTYAFMSKIMVDLLTNGNSYVRILRNPSGKPIELIPIHIMDIEIVEYDDLFFYSDNKSGDNFDTYDILHFKGLSRDGQIGLSPIDVCSASISWGLGLEKYGNDYFKNGAKVSGVLQTERALTTEAIDRLRMSFAQNYSTIGNSQKTLILEEGLKFSPISLSNEASQFLASRQFSIEEVARIFNIPPHLLRDLTKSSFNNIQEQSREFVQYSLMPYLISIEQELNCKLLKTNELGKLNFKFNTTALLRGNPIERADYYSKMLNMGAMTINEIRSKENLNAVADGDNLFMQLNMATLNNIIKGGTLENINENQTEEIIQE